MATKRKNYAKAKIWGDGISMDVEGPILGVMSSMLMLVPSEHQQKFVDHLQAEVPFSFGVVLLGAAGVIAAVAGVIRLVLIWWGGA